MKRFAKWLTELNNKNFLLIDTLVFLFTPILTLAIRLDDDFKIEPYKNGLVLATILFLVIKLSVFYIGGAYRHYWRYAGFDELENVVKLTIIAILVQTLVFNILHSGQYWYMGTLPRSLAVLDGIISLLIVAGLRSTIPAIARIPKRNVKFYRRERVLIFGAGSAGISLAKRILQSPWLGMSPVAFIDDDPQKRNLIICKLPIIGNRHDIPEVVSSLHVRKVIIAIPTAPGEIIREIVNICQSAGVQTSTIPGINEIVNGRVSLGNVRDVQIEDLLRREPIKTDVEKVTQLLKGKRVLITGSGGSIGSEICRQIFSCRPAEIVLVGHGENSVFNIQQEMQRVVELLKKDGESAENIPRLTTFIADIRFISRLRYAFDKFRPEIVFHAAAHKHVPLMELNPPEAITNNVRGTKNLLDMALQYGVEHFVMISTDKAVNPTNVMGASKRTAEMLVLRAAQRSGKPYVVVRFGNVLGSRGSVVPTFKQQITQGGPITITHPDICRYFMTIPEAVQLTLQAAVLGNGGEVFMLDMGKPVKIVDLAKDLIRLSGYEVGKDIDIVFTGLRPGEKLYEELFIPGETYEQTAHEKLLTVGNASRVIPVNIEHKVEAICEAADDNDYNLIIFLLEQLVPEYKAQYAGANSQLGLAKNSLEEAQIINVQESPNKERNGYIVVSVQEENELRQAFEDSQFRIYYQPIFHLESEKIIGFESLLRWQHPTRGLIMADEFIAAAEQTGFMIPIGWWTIRESCEQMVAWQKQFHVYPPLTIGVNMTSKQLLYPDLINHLSQIIKETNIDPCNLKLEIPENSIAENTQVVISILLKLKNLGVQLQIDNCRVNESFLTRLYDFPSQLYGKIDSIKLSCSLVSGMDRGNSNVEILDKIMAVAQELGMGVIATGVENIWQIERLKALKCRYAQGYFFSLPIEREKVQTLIGVNSSSS